MWEREIKEKEAFVFAAAQCLIQGESPGKNFSGNSRTARRQDHRARGWAHRAQSRGP